VDMAGVVSEAEALVAVGAEGLEDLEAEVRAAAVRAEVGSGFPSAVKMHVSFASLGMTVEILSCVRRPAKRECDGSGKID
jgi:hypothetical protein